MLDRIKKAGSKIGIDETVGLALLTRVVQAAGALGVVFVIARFLTGNLQGYYYTFASIIAIQIFFELGLSGIITQYAAHEYAHLTITDSFDIEGEEYHQSRLSSLLHFCVKWFGVVAFFLFFLLLAVGFYFFTSYNKTSQYVEWQSPWIVLSLATSLNLLIDPTLAFLDGVGRIKQMSKIRLIQKTVNVIVLFGLLIFNFKLYSSALASLIAVLCIYIILLKSENFKFLKNIWRKKSNWIVNYKKEIFPYQWRIALSWISGYFIFQLFNPVLFSTEGPVVAGQMGMTIQVLNGVSALSMSWIITKIPVFSSLIASKKYNELDILFNKTLKNLNLVNNALLVGFIIAVLLLGYYNAPLRLRLLPTFPLICMAFTVIINQYIFSWATYLRCHKQEPLLVQSIVSGAFVSFSTIVFGKMYGLKGIVIPYTLWVMICFIWVYTTFQKKKREWHQIDLD
jgi:O-antigen/teichoic acid export membrane protein